jgi:hypothetical protein
MARGRKTGGRRRSTPNKATIEKALVMPLFAGMVVARLDRLSRDVRSKLQ